MKRLHKIIQALQQTVRFNFGKKASTIANSEATQQIALGGNFYSKDEDSILSLVNSEENEFLFI